MLDIRFINNLVHGKIDASRLLDRIKFHSYLGQDPVINRFSKLALVKQVICVMILSKEQCELLIQTLIS